MEKVLPNGWIETELGEVTTKPQYGWTTKSLPEGKFKYLRTTDIGKGKIRWNNVPFCEDLPDDINKYLLEINDILISRAGSIGLSYLVDDDIHKQKSLFASYLIRFKPLINAKLISYFLNSKQYWRAISENSIGIAVQNINAPKLQAIPFPLPPLAEQERIVAKLDKLFAQHEKIKAALDRIPQLLKNFRQQVLTHAVTGKLTEQWREGKNLEEWKEVDLQEVSKIVDPHPSHRTPPEVENGIPYISIGDINLDKSINFKKSRKVSEKILEEHIARYTIKKGDFIFGKIGTIGKPIKIPAKQNYCLSANVILIQPNENLIISEYVYIYLDSPYLLKKVLEKSVATSQAAYGIKKMRVEKINLPSRIEQQEIVSRVESLFAKADAIEARYTNLKKKIDSLPQAILHKAFKGELVPQLPTDGDAKDLLAAIIKLKEEAKGKRGKR